MRKQEGDGVYSPPPPHPHMPPPNILSQPSHQYATGPPPSAPQLPGDIYSNPTFAPPPPHSDCPLQVPVEEKDMCCGLFCIGLSLSLVIGPFAYLFLIWWEQLFASNGMVSVKEHKHQSQCHVQYFCNMHIVANIPLVLEFVTLCTGRSKK